MPCYIQPEYLEIYFSDLVPEKQQEVLKIFPDMEPDQIVASVEYDPAMCYLREEDEKIISPDVIKVDGMSKLANLNNSQVYFNPGLNEVVNNGATYAYHDWDGYCDYRMFFMDGENLLFYNAWENDDGSLRFTEVDGDEIQYIQMPFDTVKSMTVEELHKYVLEQYEACMCIDAVKCDDFRVFESFALPGQIVSDYLPCIDAGQQETGFSPLCPY